MVKEFNKSLSNTSTTSIESGIFDIDFIPDDCDDIDEVSSEVQSIGETVKKIISDAEKESRVIGGWTETVNYLNETENPEHSLFFFFVPCDEKSKCDSISHMREVMMKAFCLDHDIYVIQLDSEQKLSALLGSESYQCALIQRSSTLKCENPEDEIDLDEFSDLENLLIDYCEQNWYEPIQPVIRLPEK